MGQRQWRRFPSTPRPARRESRRTPRRIPSVRATDRHRQTGRAAPRRAAGTRSQFDLLQRDFGFVEHAQAQTAGVLDVSWFANEVVGVWILAEVALLDEIHGAVEDADGAFGLALFFDDVDEQAVNGYRVGTEHHALGKEAEAVGVLE